MLNPNRPVLAAGDTLRELMLIRHHVPRKEATERLCRLVASLQSGVGLESNVEIEISRARAIAAIAYLSDCYGRRGLVPEPAWANAISRTYEWAVASQLKG